MRNQMAKVWWETGRETPKLLCAPRNLTVHIQVLLKGVFWFRKEKAGNADLFSGNLDKIAGRLISLIVTDIAPV